jgi:hypothetical protein
MAQKSGLGSGSLEDSVSIQCPSPPNQVEGVERRAEPGSLEDSVPFRCPGLPEQVGCTVRPWWPFDKCSASLMKSEKSVGMILSPPSTYGR